jgi:multisubunit Na+/H+ antiporter MnhF subunit
MRAVFNLYIGRAMVVLIVGSILSIAVVKFFNNDLGGKVPITTPAAAATDLG